MITLTKITAKIGMVAGAFMIMAAAPASANSAATAETSVSEQASQEKTDSALGESNPEFRTLFADWQSLERKPASGVSVPSRMPVENIRMTSGYGMRDHPVLRKRAGHKGVDLAGAIGTPIYATADGIVSEAKWFGSYGRYVEIEHGGSFQTRYAHMSRLNVQPNQHVKKGEVIGYMGSTGRSTGSHLHYEVRIDGEAVNPLPYMRAESYAEAALVEGGQGGPEGD